MSNTVCEPVAGECAPEPVAGCCDDWPEHSPELRRMARDLAWRTLGLLTGQMVGTCPVLLRPCVESPCGQCQSAYWSSLPWIPRVVDGRWTNVSCNPSGCSCRPLHEIKLPGPAHSIEVLVDGNVFSYWKQYGSSIVRTDGEPWPSCQNLDVDERKPGTFAVRYTPGVPLTAAGLWAYSVLACEYAKACTGAKCRLPASVTSVSRGGISMTFDKTMFPDGTGIREVDAFVHTLNPNKLLVRPMVWSPDVRTGWYAG